MSGSKRSGTSQPSWDAAAFDRLRKVLRSFGTMEDASRIVGRRPGTLHHYLQGNRPPKRILEKISELANVNPDWIITGVGPMRPDTVVQPLTDSMASRISTALNSISDKQLSEITPLPRKSIEEYVAKREIPYSLVVSLFEALDLPVDLAYSGDDGEPIMVPARIVPPPTAHGPIPVIELMEVGMGAWYEPKVLKIKTDRPAPLLAPDAFSVRVRDERLLRKGLIDGVLVYCDPALNYKESDLVYLEKLSSRRALGGLRYVSKVTPDTVTFAYWEDEGKFQEEKTETLQRGQIKQIAVVVLANMRL